MITASASELGLPSTIDKKIGEREYYQAMLNLLEDFHQEKEHLRCVQIAMLNILDDASSERVVVEDTQRAVLNILDDAADDKVRLEASQSAMLNILDDYELEKVKAEDETRKQIGLNKALRQAMDNLQSAQGQLVESEKMASLGGLVAGIAHEVNTPLGISVTAASLLQDNIQKARDEYRNATLTASQLETLLETGGEAVGLLMSNLQRAAELISGFKLIAVDQTSFDRREIQLKSYLDDVVRSVAPALRHLKLTIEVDCDPCLILDTFPGAWSQIVTNLLMNTAIHGFDEGESGRVRIQVSGESTDLQILYTDSGKGVPEDVRAKIFNPFFTTRRGQGGSGLGMHIVSNLIHNAFFGSISCLDSESGASFLIRLPNGGCLPLQGGDL